MSAEDIYCMIHKSGPCDCFCGVHGSTPCDCPVWRQRCDTRLATQEELRQHCIDTLGMSKEDIGEGEIPQGVLSLSNRPLTEAEEEYAKTLKPTLGTSINK